MHELWLMSVRYPAHNHQTDWSISAMKRHAALPFHITLLGAALLQCSLDAGAQTPPAENQRATQIEEVMVTARRVAEDIQSVPTAISAIGAKDLAGLRIEGFQTVGQTIPNLYINKQGGSPAAPQMNMQRLQRVPEPRIGFRHRALRRRDLSQPFRRRGLRDGRPRTHRGDARTAGNPVWTQLHGRRDQPDHCAAAG